MSDQVLLRDLVAIPDEVHAGDFVLSLAKGVGEKSTITEYVVTEPLASPEPPRVGVPLAALPPTVVVVPAASEPVEAY